MLNGQHKLTNHVPASSNSYTIYMYSSTVLRHTLLAGLIAVLVVLSSISSGGTTAVVNNWAMENEKGPKGESTKFN